MSTDLTTRLRTTYLYATTHILRHESSSTLKKNYALYVYLSPLKHYTHTHIYIYIYTHTHIMLLVEDDVQFTRNDSHNLYGFHYRGQQNTHPIVQSNLQQRILTDLWGGLLVKYLPEPYFMVGRSTLAYSTNFLGNKFLLYFPNEPISKRGRMQHDWAPPYFGREATAHLKEICGGKWIRKGWPVTWPPRSPNLTLQSFFLCSCVRFRV